MPHSKTTAKPPLARPAPPTPEQLLTRFEAALKGSERAQLMNIVESLARHIRCLVVTAPSTTWSADVRTTSLELADSALHYLVSLPQTFKAGE